MMILTHSDFLTEIINLICNYGFHRMIETPPTIHQLFPLLFAALLDSIEVRKEVESLRAIYINRRLFGKSFLPHVYMLALTEFNRTKSQ